ncbi:uncharacterized protein LAJ45_11461 [Morchella importuna]|uniref:uncharacterized protein n=1 Tax=Morchella importuna TaxID=1174673 RepID=UPI001E8CB57E|nr:uncharacterized protein LAJ45_11461 [Morchella importuna]KAH8144521.1 hypothetical protein LAJ45_11461 [Morchella importuna]
MSLRESNGTTSSKLTLLGEIWYLLKTWYSPEEIMGHLVLIHCREDADVVDKLNSPPFFDLVRQLATLFLQLQSQLQTEKKDTSTSQILSLPSYKSLKQTITILVERLRTLLLTPTAEFEDDLPVQNLLVMTILAGFQILRRYSDAHDLPDARCTSLLREVVTSKKCLGRLLFDETTMLRISLELVMDPPSGNQLSCLCDAGVGLSPVDTASLLKAVKRLVKEFQDNWLASYCAIYDIIHSIAISIIHCQAHDINDLQDLSELCEEILNHLQIAPTPYGDGRGDVISLKIDSLNSLANILRTIQSELCETTPQPQSDEGDVILQSPGEVLELQSLQRFRDLLSYRKDDVFHQDLKAHVTISNFIMADNTHTEDSSSGVADMQRLYSVNCINSHQHKESAISSILKKNRVGPDSKHFNGLALSDLENCPKCFRTFNYLREVEPVRKLVDQAREQKMEKETWEKEYLDRRKVTKPNATKVSTNDSASTTGLANHSTPARSPISDMPSGPNHVSAECELLFSRPSPFSQKRKIFGKFSKCIGRMFKLGQTKRSGEKRSTGIWENGDTIPTAITERPQRSFGLLRSRT